MSTKYDGLPRGTWIDVPELVKLRQTGRDLNDIGTIEFRYVNGRLDQNATRIILKRRRGRPIEKPE